MIPLAARTGKSYPPSQDEDIVNALRPGQDTARVEPQRNHNCGKRASEDEQGRETSGRRVRIIGNRPSFGPGDALRDALCFHTIPVADCVALSVKPQQVAGRAERCSQARDWKRGTKGKRGANGKEKQLEKRNKGAEGVRKSRTQSREGPTWQQHHENCNNLNHNPASHLPQP